MREIKFRAWGGYADDDGDETRYFVYFGIDNVRNEWIENFEEHPKGGTLLHDKKNVIAIQQFTGLHDKNGKEIYEGDVFQCVSGDGKATMQGETYFENGEFRMKYGYQSPHGDQRKDYFLSSSIGTDGAKKIEIIGNIYENPELVA